jgi:hypothetical protein
MNKLSKNSRLKGDITSGYYYEDESSVSKFDVERVIFNYPATIVLWKDGTKTVVKTQNDELYDCEKGLAMCFVKKALGNKGNYYNAVKKYTGGVITGMTQDTYDKIDEAWRILFHAYEGEFVTKSAIKDEIKKAMHILCEVMGDGT